MSFFASPRLLSVGVVLLSTMTVGFADQILFERDLPSLNINTGASRSNYAPVNTGTVNGLPYILGDDFSLGGSGMYFVNTITLYVVLGTPGDSFAQEISGLTLYGGTDASLSALSSTFASQQVKYAGTLNYQSQANANNFLNVYSVTFSNLNWLVSGGTFYDFALSATTIGSNTLALSASTNPPNSSSGGIQNGPDGTYLLFTKTGAAPYVLTASCNCNPGEDINVVISGNATPEPSTFALMGMSGLAVVGLRRRKK